MADCIGCGYDSYKSAWEVYHGVRAKRPFSSFQQQCVDDGLAAEAVIRNLLITALEPNCAVLECGMYRREVRDGLALLATPDGFIRDARRDELFVLEMKRPRILYRSPKLNHLLQIFTQLFCTNLRRAVYACWTPEEGMRVWVVEMNPEARTLFRKVLLPAVVLFRKQGEAPPSLAKHVYPLVERHLQLPKPDNNAQLKQTLLGYLSTCHRRLQWPPRSSVTSPVLE